MALTKVTGSGIGTITDNIVITSDDPTITMTDSSGTNDIATIQSTSGALIFTARDGSSDGEIIFKKTDGSATDESMRINASGQVAIGTSSADGLLTLSGTDNPLARFTHTQNADESLLILQHGYAQSSQTATMIQFRDSGGSERGTIKTSGSATAYNTSSDYRLKENVTYDFDATSRLKQLKPARFNFIVDADTTVDGFLAHEVASIVPEAIDGKKDAVDADNNPIYQGIDQSKLVPLLVKTIQELEARITALESK